MLDIKNGITTHKIAGIHPWARQIKKINTHLQILANQTAEYQLGSMNLQILESMPCSRLTDNGTLCIKKKYISNDAAAIKPI